MRTIREFFAAAPAPYVVIAAVTGAVLYLAERATPWQPFWSYGNREAMAFSHGLIALWAVGLAAAPLIALRWPVGAALLGSAPLCLGVMSENEWPCVIYAALVVIAFIASWNRPRTAVAIGIAALAPVASVVVGASEMLVPYGARIDAAGHGPVDVSLAVGYLLAAAVFGALAYVCRWRLMRSASQRASVRLPNTGTAHIGAPRRAASVEGIESLSRREQDVFLELAAGRSNAEIAESLHIGIETVKSHVAEILRKLVLRDRVHAVVFAYENGLVGAPRS